MIDIKVIRDNPDAFDAALAKRGADPQSAALLVVDAKRREVVAATQEAQTRRNVASKEIGAAKGRGDEEAAQKAIAEVAQVKKALQEGEEQERQLTAEMDDLLARLPNIPYDAVPVGAGEEDNVEHHYEGAKKNFDFTPKEHFDVGEALGMMDFEAAAKMSGARFVVLRQHLAKLERALANFMLDLHTEEKGYTEVSPPVLVRDEAMYGTGQLPKFTEDAFHTEDGFWLVPTAEVPLTNLFANRIVNEAELPARMTAYTPCFRSEAGSAGRDTRGMIRLHQFSKVEMVSVTTPETSDAELERMLGCAEDVLKRLGLHYRVMTLCTGDMGFGARQTYDIEVWLPGQNAYREISSCSVCGDFQARRMGAKYRPEGEKGTKFVHTLNGSGLAVGRTMVALLETYQQEDGSVVVPEVLRPYMGGLEVMRAHG
ncbi:MAG: seryl-tRNA synthetase [Parvibaculaceae bacterium]|jgi:seryl-tRNA synthetase|tara:strand:- start:168 stop:1451 length:1284 start_codon:yes stop_codon:yes gene_type:complete